MAEYIDRIAFRKKIDYHYPFNKFSQKDPKYDYAKSVFLRQLATFPAADVVEQKTCKNVATEYDDCDQFVCSECGIELQEWHRVERDEDDGDVTYHEYILRFCPNCGAKIIEGDEHETT